MPLGESSGYFDYVIVNDDKERAFDQLVKIVEKVGGLLCGLILLGVPSWMCIVLDI